MSVTSVEKTYYRVDGRIRGSFVYMLLCQDSDPIYVKVGLSDSPLERLQSLRNGCPVTPLRFAFAPVPSRLVAKRVESALLHEFSPWGTQGEWFKFAAEEKPAFNFGWKEAFRKTTIPGWELKWNQISVAEMVKTWAARRRYARRLWKQRGAAYQAFVRDCKA